VREYFISPESILNRNIYTKEMTSIFGVNVAPNSGDNVQGVPVGTVIQYASATAPVGYLNCDGSAISRTTYGGLFGLIGTTYGAGNGSQISITSIGGIGVNPTVYTMICSNSNNYIVTGTTFTISGNSTYSGTFTAVSASTATVTFNGNIGTGAGFGGYAVLATPTTFNLPNTVGVTIRGSGTSWNIGSTGGADSYALTPANIASHKHDTTITANGSGAASGGISTSAPPTSGTSYTTGIIYDNTGTQVTAAGSNGSSFSTLNQYLVLNYCIKY